MLFKRNSCLPFSPKHVIVKYLLKLPALGQVAPWLCQGLGREGVCGGEKQQAAEGDKHIVPLRTSRT